MRRGAWVPQLACLLECLGGSVVYGMVLGDVFSPLLQHLPIFASLGSRWTAILGIGVTVLYPLCCLKSFGQLAKFSLLGTLASSYVVVFVVKRFLDGSYAPQGMYHTGMQAAVVDPSGGVGMNLQVLVLVSVLATAYLVHFNAPQMYTELAPGGAEAPELSEGERRKKFRRFGLVAGIGFSIAALQYALVMTFGFLTFGKATAGNLLSNYATNDPGATAARVAVGVSTIFGYPMQFAGLRDEIFETVHRGKALSDGVRRLTTAALLAAVLGTACMFRDLGHFQAIEGALMASFLTFIAPAMMAMRFNRGLAAKTSLWVLGLFGVFAAGVGSLVTLGFV